MPLVRPECQPYLESFTCHLHNVEERWRGGHTQVILGNSLSGAGRQLSGVIPGELCPSTGHTHCIFPQRAGWSCRCWQELLKCLEDTPLQAIQSAEFRNISKKWIWRVSPLYLPYLNGSAAQVRVSRVICWGFLCHLSGFTVPLRHVDLRRHGMLRDENSEGETDSRMFRQLSPSTGKKKGHCLLLPQTRLRLTVLLLSCQETNLRGHCCPASPFSSSWFEILCLSCLPVQLCCVFWSRERLPPVCTCLF